MELPYVTLDVFTATRFRGNPLAVVTIPHDIPPLTQEQKQTIAREFNLSETVFIHDEPDHDETKSRRIDIFLTHSELPFAGNPTIGAAVHLLPQAVQTLVTKAGPISISTLQKGIAQITVPYHTHMHQKRLKDIPLDAQALSSNLELRGLELNAPIFSPVQGMSFVLTELPSLALLGEVRQDGTRFPADQLLDQGWAHGFIARYFFVRTGLATDEKGTPRICLRARMIEHSFEDPATGAAACALCCYLSLEGDKQTTSLRRYEITQGVEMGKESKIVVEITMNGGAIEKVTLAGTAVQVMEGRITI